MAFVSLDTNDMVIPVLIPQTAQPAVTGWNSNWLIAGGIGLALLASWGLFGSKVAPAVRRALSGGGRKKATGKRVKSVTTTYK